MMLSTIFWMLMILWGLALLGVHFAVSFAGEASIVLQYALFAILGYQVFGAMVKRG